MPDEDGFRTTSIRLPVATLDTLKVIADLEGCNVSNLYRQAIDGLVESKRTDPRLAERAQAIRAQIEADNASRLASIDSLISQVGNGGASAEPGQRKGRARRTGS